MTKYLNYLFQSKKAWFIAILSFLFCFLIPAPFNKFTSASFYGLMTYNSCTARYVDYCSKPEECDSFIFYKDSNNVSVNFSEDENSAVLPSEVYQQINNCTYTAAAIFEKKEGVSFSLGENECAIPEEFQRRFGLELGDSLFINGINKVNIVAIYYDVFQIKKADIYSEIGTVLVGYNSQKYSNDFLFANFRTTGSIGSDSYSLDSIKSSLLNNLLILAAIQLCLFVIAELVVSKFYFNSEISAFYRINLSGYRNIFLLVCLIECFFTLLPFIFGSLSSYFCFGTFISVVSALFGLTCFLCKVLIISKKCS
jgi:hypothetical protein